MHIDDNTRLLHMLDAAREAIELSEGKTRDTLDVDRMFSLAMVRLVEILCEAAYQVSQEKQYELAHIDFKSVIGMRKRGKGDRFIFFHQNSNSLRHIILVADLHSEALRISCTL